MVKLDGIEVTECGLCGSTDLYQPCDSDIPGCRDCGAQVTSWNTVTKEVTGWLDAATIEASQAEYERQMFSADMNEMYGRGNHCF